MVSGRHRAYGGSSIWANIKVVVFRCRADVGTRAGWYRADIGPMVGAGDTWRADVVKCTCRLPYFKLSIFYAFIGSAYSSVAGRDGKGRAFHRLRSKSASD